MTDPESRIEFPGMLGKIQTKPTFDNFMSGLNRMSHLENVVGRDEVTQGDIDNYFSLTMGKGGTGYKGETIDSLWDLHKGGQRGEGGIDPHVFRNTGLTQGGGGGGGATAAPTTTPSAFQQSLTAGATNPFDYYVGQDPTAANLAWGEKFGVDPRTMYRTSWAADG